MEKLKGELENWKLEQTKLETDSKEWLAGIGSSMKSLKELLKKVKTQETQLKSFGKDLPRKVSDKSDQGLIKKDLDEQQKQMKKLKNTLHPATGSLFVRLFLGRVNVKHYTDEDRYKLKAEYQKFKRRTDPMFICLVVLRMFSNWRLIELLSQVWILYYYITLSLRENILKVNGSNIKPWWIFHHYLAMMICLLQLVWDSSSPHYIHFKPIFLTFALLQGFVQIMQTRYQSSKLYQQIAMGKARSMDVENTDSSFDCSLGMLFPLLLLHQLFQIYLGLNCLVYVYDHAAFQLEWVFEEYEISAVGLLFLILGIGNLMETWRTYYEKFKKS